MSQVYSGKVDRIGGETKSGWEEVYTLTAEIGVSFNLIGFLTEQCGCCQILFLLGKPLLFYSR
jgi:hypothetical protein